MRSVPGPSSSGNYSVKNYAFFRPLQTHFHCKYLRQSSHYLSKFDFLFFRYTFSFTKVPILFFSKKFYYLNLDVTPFNNTPHPLSKLVKFIIPLNILQFHKHASVRVGTEYNGLCLVQGNIFIAFLRVRRRYPRTPTLGTRIIQTYRQVLPSVRSNT